ncbi:MAG: hypothetical protein EAX86_08690 [Candidatus Heimdallarchaeota archaeon]|nr:hypothetical protein [Candidatus Heimdallarchaeota archaeon]
MEFNQAWNEWVHGNETKAAEIWSGLLEKIRGISGLSNEELEIDILNMLAMYQRIWEGKVEDFFDVQQLLIRSKNLGYEKGEAYCLIELALRTNSSEEAIKYFHESQSIFLHINDKIGLIRSIYVYSKYLIRKGTEKFGYIFKKLQTALQYAIEENNKYFIAQIHHGIGEAFLRLGNLEEAKHHLDISLQIFRHLNNERKIVALIVSLIDVEIQTREQNPIDTLREHYEYFNSLIKEVREKIPITDLFNHISRYSDLFLELGEYKQVDQLLSRLNELLRQANINSSLYFEGKMALALIKGNVELSKLNLENAEELYTYIIKRRDQARVSDLYGALISLAVISIYKYRIYFNTEHLSIAQNLIQDAIHIAEETDHIRGYVRASMVDAMLKITIGNQDDDLSEMERVLDVAQQKGLHIEARKAHQELSRFKRIASFKQTKLEDRSVAEVLQYALEAKKMVRKS